MSHKQRARIVVVRYTIGRNGGDFKFDTQRVGLGFVVTKPARIGEYCPVIEQESNAV